MFGCRTCFHYVCEKCYQSDKRTDNLDKEEEDSDKRMDNDSDTLKRIKEIVYEEMIREWSSVSLYNFDNGKNFEDFLKKHPKPSHKNTSLKDQLKHY